MAPLLSRLFIFMAILLFGLGPNPSVALASGMQSPAEASAFAASHDFASLEQALTDIEVQKETIKDLQRRVAKSEGLAKRAFEVRLDKTWLALLEQGLNFAHEVAEKKGVVSDIDKYRVAAIKTLDSQNELAYNLAEQIQTRIKIPDPGLPAAEQAVAYTKIFAIQDSLNQAYDLLIQSLELAKTYQLDVAEETDTLKRTLADRATDQAIFLEMLMHDVIALRSNLAALPADDETQARLAVLSKQVHSLAGGLSTLLVMMDSLNMETSAYRELVLSATGEITSDVFEVSVITNLFIGWGQTLWNVIIEDGPDLIFKILLFFIIVYLFRKLANVVQKVTEEGLKRSHLQLSELLRRMVVSTIRNTIIVLGLLIALSQVGFSLGPVLAGLGVVGVVIGFALQDTLSNFASGMMILTYRPYDVGDLIEAAGVYGRVSDMSLVNTTIMTLDNQTIVMPNNKIWGDVIKNVQAQTRRRVDMKFGISYSDDIPKAEQVLQSILDADDRILSDPKPIIRVHELGDSSVNIIVWPWVNRDDYWDVYWDVTRAVKIQFDKEGLSIPFPQRDVHIFTQSPDDGKL
jgi:small conductance mechanosensitive channel